MKTVAGSTLLLFAAALLAGCAGLPRPGAGPPPPPPAGQVLFDQGLAEIARGAEAASLERLRRAAPDGEWGARAAVVSELLAEVEREAAEKEREAAEKERALGQKAECDGTNARLAEERERLRGEIAAAKAEHARLLEENERLRSDLAQLKNLTIEMEMRR